jgi:RNAse (barnase) inhibitor barstar
VSSGPLGDLTSWRPRVAHACLDGKAITDWRAFHHECAQVFGFPDFYGRNMNAWIDCLTYVREGDGMSRYVLGPDEPLIIEVRETESLKNRVPEVLDALVECAAAVNLRQRELGERPALQLLFL